MASCGSMYSTSLTLCFIHAICRSSLEPVLKPSHTEVNVLCKVLETLRTIFMKLVWVFSCLISVYFLPPKSEYCLKYPVLKHSQSGLPPMWKTKFSAQEKLTDKIMVGNHYQLTLCNIPKEKHHCSERFNPVFRQQRTKTRGCKVKSSKNFLLLIFFRNVMFDRVVSILTSIDCAHYLIH